ncbi:MAG: hypothetical protein WA987_12685 [Cellvibrio sp.]|jgi:hypothetical protein
MPIIPRLLSLGSLSLALAAAPSFAQDIYESRSYGPTSGWSWSAHVDHINIDDKIAAEQGIEDYFTAIGGAAEYYTSESNMTLSLGLSIILYDDNAEFRQRVEDWWGDEYYESSDATGGQAFIEYGPKIKFGANENSFVVVRGGLSGIFFSERSISNCRNCYSEDIDVDGGLYGVLGVGHRLGYFDIGLQFHQYFSGDLDNGFRLKLSSSF